ncbi:DUF1738 domain-containing protein [Sphingomonas sp. JC676]|uniref:ArdC family protein n=1 Tax=Sphingomonas sp. JC676 TaxID=2768065 RepID=UPI001657913A|nr:zincin-like metallopeptidase domain-containing protein [Sphingomonas sp. JC676]MBC9032686.1 DUF1738 domain-containing protein [Sphingomonas sp. JC676]
MRKLFQSVTDEIIAAIEAGAGDYTMPWHVGAAGLPVNAASGRAYSGTNTLLLWAAAPICGYSSSRWATYRQWAELGAQVRKGEKATTVLFWKTLAGDADQALDEAGDARQLRFVARAFRVFNAAQVDGIDDEAPLALNEGNRIERAERFFNQLPAMIWYGSESAFFDQRADMISMPDFTKFRSAEAFYSVLSHELVHWSGARHRLGRNLKGLFGSEAYAMEELIAEMGAAFLCARLGLSIEPRRDHAPYIDSWLKVLQGDPRAIITAASRAQISVNFLVGLASGEIQAACAGQAA